MVLTVKDCYIHICDSCGKDYDGESYYATVVYAYNHKSERKEFKKTYGYCSMKCFIKINDCDDFL